MWVLLIRVYIALLIGVSIIAFIKKKQVDTSTRLIVILILATTLSEIIAHILLIRTTNNLVVYHIFTATEFLLLSAYFNSIVSFFKKKKIGLVIGIIGCLISIFNSIYIQPYNTTFNTNFLVIESIVLVTFCLCYFYDFLKTTHKTSKYITPQFWIACILLTFWSFTSLRWILEMAAPGLVKRNIEVIRTMMYVINMITYTGFGLVFLFYKKLQNDE